jgi:hypothetical protein
LNWTPNALPGRCANSMCFWASYHPVSYLFNGRI